MRFQGDSRALQFAGSARIPGNLEVSCLSRQFRDPHEVPEAVAGAAAPGPRPEWRSAVLLRQAGSFRGAARSFCKIVLPCSA